MKAHVVYSSSDKGDDEVIGCTTDWNFREITKENRWIRIPLGFLYSDSVLFDEGFVFATASNVHWKTDQNQLRLVYPGADVPKHVATELREIGAYLRGISYYSASQFTDPTRCPASFELDEDRLVRRSRFRSTDHVKFMMDLYRSYKTRKKSNVYDEFINIVGCNGLHLFDKLDFKEVSLPESRYQVSSGGRVTKQKVSRNLIVPSVVLDGAKLSLGQLSEGTFKTMALLFYLASDRSHLLLIEEPEVCVHHGLLTSIVELIKSYSATKQVIFSTHSDFVLDRLTPEEVFLVTRRSKLGTSVRNVPRALSKSNFSSLKQYLEEAGNLGEYWRHGGFDTQN